MPGLPLFLKRLSRHSSRLGPASASSHACKALELHAPLELDSNDALAVMAYSEALETMAIKNELIDALLVEEMSHEIDRYRETSESADSRSVSKALLPKAKEVIHDYYVSTTKDTVSHEDTYRQAHETFDVDLLQSLTHTYARTFIRQYYCPRH